MGVMSWFFRAVTGRRDDAAPVEPSATEIKVTVLCDAVPPSLPPEATSLPATPSTEPLASTSRPLHWSPTGEFPLFGIGTSNYEAALAALAQNPKGANALVFCTASLVPEDTNPHDPNAVMVAIEGQKVGYLPRAYAQVFRGYFEKFGLPIQVTTCDAVLSNGLKTADYQYAYSIELDIALEPSAPTNVGPTYPRLDRRSSSPVSLKQEDGRYLVKVRLGQGVREDMQEVVDSWTTDHWDEINYYARNSKNLGLGHKLFGVPKPLHRQMFGEYEPDACIESLVGRTAVIAMRSAVLPSVPELERRMQKYAYVFNDRLPAVETQDQWWNETRSSQAAGDRKAGSAHKWFEPFVPEVTASIELLLQKAAWGPQSLPDVIREVRALIRTSRKAKQPHEDLLKALYGSCLAVDFVAALTFEGTSAQELALHVDVRELQALNVDYSTMGHQGFKTLAGQDVKWLVAAFGEPHTHQVSSDVWRRIRSNAISQYCWSKVAETHRGASDAVQRAAIKDWLERKVTENFVYNGGSG